MWSNGCALALLVFVAAVPAAGQVQQSPPRPVIDPPVQYARVLPEACVAVPEVVDMLRLEGRSDSALYTPARDRVSPEAQAEVARCVEAQRATEPRPWQWLVVARAQLALGNDGAAKAWHNKYLAHVASAPLPQRAWALQLVAVAYGDAQPPRITAAEAALWQLDALGRPVARARMLAHKSLMDGATRQWNDTLRLREAKACVAAYRELTEALRDLMRDEASLCFMSQAEVALRREGGPAAVAILDTALSVLPPGSIGIQQWRSRYALVGQPGPPIEATRWFGRPGTDVRPVPGKVTLLHAVDHSRGDEAQYQALRRLDARFAGRPFELIAQSKTQGFFGDSALPITPEREMVLDSAYFYGYARMPGMLAVSATPLTIAADGRRRSEPTPHEKHYVAAPLVLIDKRGIVRYVGQGVGGVDEEHLMRLIDRLLAEP